MTETAEGNEARDAVSWPRLTIYLVSLFPNLFDSWLQQGVVARALERGIIAVKSVPVRPFGLGRHLVTDDYPFGGGPGMVMKPEPLFAAIESLRLAPDTQVTLMSPRGKPFDQRMAESLSRKKELVLVAGHYEGIDERVREHLITQEISIGDYVLSSGELAAMVVTDAVVRLVPGVLTGGSAEDESFSGGLLEYPHYTRPAEFRGWRVPDILLSGNHGAIAAWRRRQAITATVRYRPDLLSSASLNDEELAWVRDLQKELEGHSLSHLPPDPVR